MCVSLSLTSLHTWLCLPRAELRCQRSHFQPLKTSSGLICSTVRSYTLSLLHIHITHTVFIYPLVRLRSTRAEKGEACQLRSTRARHNSAQHFHNFLDPCSETVLLTFSFFCEIRFHFPSDCLDFPPILKWNWHILFTPVHVFYRPLSFPSTSFSFSYIIFTLFFWSLILSFSFGSFQPDVTIELLLLLFILL